MASLRASRHALAATLVAALCLAPLAQAGYRTYGDPVAETEAIDVVHVLKSASLFNSIATIEEEGDIVGIYLNLDNDAAVSTMDIRFLGTSGTKGNIVKQTDGDFDDGFTGTASWGFVDLFPVVGTVDAVGAPVDDGDGMLGIGDPVVVDLDDSGAVDSGDWQISTAAALATNAIPTKGATAGKFSAPASNLVGRSIQAMPAATILYFDADNNDAFNSQDLAYLDLDNLWSGGPSPGDLRLNNLGVWKAGTQPDIDDDDMLHGLTDITPAFAFIDNEDADGLFLDMDGSGNVTLGDLRFIASGSATAGSGKIVVTVSESDVGDPLASLGGAAFVYADHGVAGLLDVRDDVYLSVTGGATVAAGDFRILKGTGSSFTGAAKARVVGSSTDVGVAVDPLPASLAYFDADGGGAYSRGDTLYLDGAGFSSEEAQASSIPGMVSAGDVRLADVSGLTFGESITDAEPDMAFCYTFQFPDAVIGFVDADNNPVAVVVDEMVYLDLLGDMNVTATDIRLSTVDTLKAGTFVKSSDTDQGDDLLDIPGHSGLSSLMLRDAVSAAGFTLGTTDDAAYVDVNQNSLVSINDVRITPASSGTGIAGSKVTATASGDSNQALVALPAMVFAVDSNGDGTYGSSDAFYFDLDGEDDDGSCSTPGDIRVSGGGTTSGGGGGGGGTGTSDPEDDDTSTSTSTSTATSTATSTETGEPGEPNAADLNEELRGSLDVSRDGDDNLLSWTDTSGESAYQVWSHHSPYVLVAKLPAGTTSYRDEGASATTAYIVTAVVGDVELTVEQVNSGAIPGYAGVPAGETHDMQTSTSAGPGGGGDDGDGDGGDRGFIPGPEPALLALALVAAVLLARRRLSQR